MDGKTQPRLFPADSFDGFGPSCFRPADDPLVGRRIRSTRAARLKRGVRDHAPKHPGVYGMLDARGRVVYVGKAKSLRCRLLSYFRENSRDPKAGKIIEHTRTLVWEQTADEFAALLRELELIQRIGPRFNVLGRPGVQGYHYVCLGRTPAPYLYITKNPTGKERGCYGPFAARARSEDAIRRLNDWFKLRDCPQTVPLTFADQGELFPPPERGPKCLRFDIGTCVGPCVGACTRAEYGAGVRAAKAFLDGRDRTLLATIQSRMETAAAGFEFEKASVLRDRLTAVTQLDDRLNLLRRARRRESLIYPLVGPDGATRWYLIHHGQVRGVMTAPTTPAARTQGAALIQATFAGPASPLVLSGGAVDSVLLVGAWFRRNPAEKEKLMTKAAALASLQVEAAVQG